MLVIILKSLLDSNLMMMMKRIVQFGVQSFQIVQDLAAQSSCQLITKFRTTTTTTTTTVPPTTSSRPGPSNCVWAVVSCCSVTTNAVPESCFEQRGCPGPFWGASPCDSDFAKAAIEAALKYYGGT
nr:unnamed protein product [Callosobruchus analis]